MDHELNIDINYENDDNDELSSSGDECNICYYKIKENDIFAILCNGSEPPNKYHPECAEKWINCSNRGILTEEPITSYKVFQGLQLIEDIRVIKNNRIDDFIDSGIDDAINEIIDDELQSSNLEDSSNVQLRGFMAFIILIVVGLSLIYSSSGEQPNFNNSYI